MTSPTALVTGGARGIGAAIADRLLAEGYVVATLDVLPPQHPGAAEHQIVDVTDSAQVQRAVTAITDRHGRLDVVVNNAGVLDVHAVHDTPEQVWDQVVAVNLKSVFLVCKASIPGLRRTGGGSIVNICSVHALASVPRAAAYAASKGAVLALTRQMALDYADDNIRVNAVVVGSVDTAMSLQHAAGIRSDGVQVAQYTGAIGRLAAPAEIANAVYFLASSQASFMTGSPMLVDGGMLARLV